MYGRHGENSTNWSEQLIGGGGDDCFAVEIRRAEKPRNMRMSMPELSRVPLKTSAPPSTASISKGDGHRDGAADGVGETRLPVFVVGDGGVRVGIASYSGAKPGDNGFRTSSPADKIKPPKLLAMWAQSTLTQKEPLHWTETPGVWQARGSERVRLRLIGTRKGMPPAAMKQRQPTPLPITDFMMLQQQGVKEVSMEAVQGLLICAFRGRATNEIANSAENPEIMPGKAMEIRSRWGHSTNTDAAVIFTALVAIPFPQYLDASAYPISALHLSQPLNGFTDTDPTAFPFTHIPRYHGCPAARPAMYSAAASTVVTGSHEQNLLTFSSDRNSSRSRWGHSTNTDAAAIFTALVAIPFPQYLDASAYPISALQLSQPLNGFTDTDPTTFPFTHIPRYHGCPAARPAMYSAAASTVVTGSHEQNLRTFSSDRHSRNRLDMTVLAVSLTLPFLLPFVDGETEV
nr:hypothetical protein Iba_chr13bCG2440 [Ipomoea batatas]